jgi:hypothetical protein
MEHMLHLFGGGCGEHLAIPALYAAISGGWLWCKAKATPTKKKT